MVKINIDGEDIEFDDNQELFEMANYRHDRLKMDVPCHVWIKTKETLSKHKHSPSLKFQNDTSTKMNNSNLCEITIDKNNPKIISMEKLNLSGKQIEDLKQWIIANYDILISFWNGEIDTEELTYLICKPR